MSDLEPRSLGNGIHLIPAPLPFRNPAWVNVYLVETGEGLLMLDCGTDWDEGRESLRAGLARLGLEETAVHTLVVTHLHLDHVGMSRRLVEEWGCRFVMHRRAVAQVDKYNDTAGYVERLLRVGRRHGVPDALLAAVSTDLGRRPDYMPAIAPPDHTVEDGDAIPVGPDRRLEVVHTPGHDSAHICLRDSRTGILFSGDHILPRISPVIMYDEDEPDPLGDYMASLQRLIGVGIRLTYPAHGSLIEHGEERARQILLHHDRRLLDMADQVRRGRSTAWEVMLESFRPNLTPLEARLAFLETVSHLEHLRLAGKVRGDESQARVIYLA